MADVVAVYALATLFNRHKNTGGEASRALEVLWAPVLLHLAGQEIITAYNIEGNELWTRHVLTVTSQVMVAVYVFCKSWSWSSQDKLILGAAIILFIAGILKCMDKPISLKRSSIYSLVSQPLVNGPSDEVSSLESYIIQAKKYAETLKVAYGQQLRVYAVPTAAFRPYQLFADLICTYGHRLRILRSFLELEDSRAHEVLKAGMELSGGAFEYLKALCYRAITIVILRIAQYINLASFARDRNPTKILKLASFFGCKDYLDQHWCVEACPSSSSLAMTELVIAQVKAGWKHYIQDVFTYWMFNDRRGQLTIQQERCNQELCRTLQGPFDEAVLVWHLATDIFFYEGACAAADRHHKTAILSREKSNYMVYLLVAHPDILMAGTRAGIFVKAKEELQEMFKDTEIPTDEGELTREIRRKAQLLDDATAIRTFIQPESKLASQLLALGSEKRWKVMQGVWVEMLCFNGSRCTCTPRV
ncbi:hypothetical protein ACP70R_003210 [Stipagrostis hirtigluma subsp. patula]